MKNVTKEQIETARKIDLLTYLQLHEPDELVRINENEYRTKTHSSLVISNGLWYYNRGGFGSSNALDYLVKVRRMPFVSAVELICGIRDLYAYYNSLPEEKAKPPPLAKNLVLPKPTKYPEKMVGYLQGRGIPPEVISRCMKLGILYESVYKNESVCVFVGFDESKTARFATVRGINSEMKQNIFGSDKHYGFFLPACNAGNSTLTVFESPIDLLSHSVLYKHDCHRLALGGVAAIGLIAFLERHREIQNVVLCLDADTAGQEAAKKIQRQLAAEKRFPHIKTTVNPPINGNKDYNEMLMQKITAARNPKIITKDKNIIL